MPKTGKTGKNGRPITAAPAEGRAVSYSGWRESGACLTADPNLFFPVENGYAAVRQMMKAQQICAQCGVRRECFNFAMETGQTHGIWGGTTPEQRTRARRKRAAARRRQTRVSLPDADAPRTQAS